MIVEYISVLYVIAYVKLVSIRLYKVFLVLVVLLKKKSFKRVLNILISEKTGFLEIPEGVYAADRLTVLQEVVGLVGAEADLCVPVALQGAGVDVGRACQHVLVVNNHQLREDRV